MSKDVEIAKLMPNFDFTDYDRIDTPEKNSKSLPSKTDENVATWDKLTETKKSCIIFSILFAILLIGIGGIITSSVLLGLGIPTKSSQTDPAKIFGIGVGSFITLSVLIIFVLIFKEYNKERKSLNEAIERRDQRIFIKEFNKSNKEFINQTRQNVLIRAPVATALPVQTVFANPPPAPIKITVVN